MTFSPWNHIFMNYIPKSRYVTLMHVPGLLRCGLARFCRACKEVRIATLSELSTEVQLEASWRPNAGLNIIAIEEVRGTPPSLGVKQLHERNTAKSWHETIAWKEHCQVWAWNNCMKGTLPSLGVKQLHERNTAKSWHETIAWKEHCQVLGVKQMHERNTAKSWAWNNCMKQRRSMQSNSSYLGREFNPLLH